MKKLIVFMILSILVTKGIAQDTLKKNASKKSYEFKKNEIGFNVSPVASFLINAGRDGNGSVSRFSLSYKHYLNERNGLRVLLIGDLIQNDQYNFYGDKGRVVFILKNDSTLVKQHSVSSSYWRPHLNLGYERLFGKRERLKWFYGADLNLGFSVQNISTVNTQMDKDTVAGHTGWIETMAYNDVLSRTRIETFSVGISPFLGAKYILSRHFSISAQVGFDAAYCNRVVSDTDISGNKKHQVSSFDLNGDTGIINDISLIYRF